MKRGVFLGLQGLTLLLIMISLVSAMGDDFNVNNILLKISVKEGGNVQRTFNINSVDGGQFNIEVVGLENVKVSDSDFVLGKGGTKPVVLSLDSFGLEKGVRVGHIKISTEKRVQILPVIIEIESRDVFFDANLDVSPQYSSVKAGGQFVANLKIFDLVSGGLNNGLGASSVDLNYYVYSIDGELLISEEESVVIDKQTQFTKAVEIPKDTIKGDYVFVVEAKYASSLGASSYLFSVVGTGGDSIFTGLNLEEGLSANLIAVLLTVVIVFGGIIFVFLYFIRDRDKLILELRRYHSGERVRQKVVLNEQAKVARKKGVSEKKIKEEVAQSVKKLKEKQKKREEEIRKLKKAGKTDEMRKTLNEWRKQGYYTLEMNSRLGKLSASEMKKAMADWKAGKK